jgi:uncharacterized protein YndB with AHSA1/START domain
MDNIVKSQALAVANTAEGHLTAGVELAVPPERVFQALASKEVTNWWIRAGVFDTQEWAGRRSRGWPVGRLRHRSRPAVYT